jgi:allantoicase
MEIIRTDIPDFTQLMELSSEKIGGKVLVCSDDFFAEKENLIKSGRGIFIADKYTDRGKWMDGWESRRKRTAGHDWCILQLGASGILKGIDIDTHHFLGNHPPFASVEACRLDGNPSTEEICSATVNWTEITAKSHMDPGSQNFFEIQNHEVWTHIRLNIYPDGGVARLKVYGIAYRNWEKVKKDEWIDLASAVNGAKSIACNDMFFSHMDNLLMPNRGINMGDGWETKRNRTPNNRDWVIIRLAHRGSIHRIVVDTCHFKGNYPDSCSIEGLLLEDPSDDVMTENLAWTTLLPPSKLHADQEHFFEKEILHAQDSFTHIRLNIFPDGGISRLRLFGFIK